MPIEAGAAPPECRPPLLHARRVATRSGGQHRTASRLRAPFPSTAMATDAIIRRPSSRICFGVQGPECRRIRARHPPLVWRHLPRSEQKRRVWSGRGG